MDIPSGRYLYEPVLRVLASADEPLTRSELTDRIADQFGLDPAARAQRIPSGKALRINHRIGWVSFALMRAGLVAYPAKGCRIITDAGRSFVAEHPNPLDDAELTALIQRLGVAQPDEDPDDDEEEESDASEESRAAAEADDPAAWLRDTVLSGYADEATRHALLAGFADTLRHAHAASPSSWVLTRRGPRLRLLVGETAAFELGLGRVGVGLHLDSIPQQEKPRVEPDTDKADYNFARIESGVLRRLSVFRYTDAASIIQAASHRFVELAAARFPNTPFARNHRPEVLVELERVLGDSLPRPVHRAATKTTYWKIAPGERARLWPECRDGGYIAIGWSELGDLEGLDRDTFDARVDTALEQYPNWKRGGLEQVWRFINIPVGARIVANEGTKRVVGIGTVTAPYRFVEDGKEFAHRIPVRWDDLRQRTVKQPSWVQTVRQLSESVFQDVMDAPSPGDKVPAAPPPEAKPVEELDFDGLMDRLDDARLRFPAELVASYLLALQAKRFVILSGISGTGKTQLAIEVARAFQPAAALAEQVPSPAPAAEARRIRVQPYMHKFSRLVVPADLVETFTADAASGRVTVQFGDGQSESLRWSAAGQATQLLFKGAFRQWFADTFEVGDELELVIESEEPAVLRVAPVAEAQTTAGPAVATYRVVAVQPDWTDNRGLLGYYNPITREYHVTAFLRLLLEAAGEEARAVAESRSRLPFFVVLDEMNLARVEHYFSDFLSCAESGEKLELHNDPRVEQGETGDPVPMYLTIPRNLFFTGTVNVDETTYMFSPKVLDRAFVLEFNDVDLAAFGGPGSDEDDASPLRLKHFAGALDIRDKPGAEDYEFLRGLVGGALHRALVSLNDRLQEENRHFGYRVASEIARFVRLAHDQAGKDPAILWDALDVAVLAKVLPKLHGTQQEIEPVLARMLAFAIDVGSAIAEPADHASWIHERGRIRASADERAGPRLPRSAAKLWRMLRRVRQQGHVSFIE